MVRTRNDRNITLKFLGNDKQGRRMSRNQSRSKKREKNAKEKEKKAKEKEKK